MNPIDRSPSLAERYTPREPRKNSESDEKLMKACQDFEAIFTNYMLSKMRDTIPRSGFFGESKAKELFESMLDEEYSKAIAASGKLGLAKVMYEQLSRKGDTK